MCPEKFPPGRAASGGSLGTMLIYLDLRPEIVEDRCGAERLQDAMNHCLACPTHVTCAHWVADGARRQDAWHGFCPNADMLLSAQTPRPRKR